MCKEWLISDHNKEHFVLDKFENNRTGRNTQKSGSKSYMRWLREGGERAGGHKCERARGQRWEGKRADMSKDGHGCPQKQPWTYPKLSTDMSKAVYVSKAVHGYVQGCLEICPRLSTDIYKAQGWEGKGKRVGGEEGTRVRVQGQEGDRAQGQEGARVRWHKDRRAKGWED